MEKKIIPTSVPFESVDSYIDLIYKTDCYGKITLANRGFCRIFGYSMDELIGKDIIELYVEPDHRIAFLSEMRSRGGFLLDYVVLVKRKNGSHIFLSVDSNYIDADESKGVEGIGRDVTYKLNLWGGYFQTNLQGRILFGNNEFAKIVGVVSPSSIILKNIGKLLISEQEFAIMLHDILEFGFWERQLGPLCDGKHIYLRVHGILNTRNQVCGLEGTIIDVSETLFLQKSLEQNRKILEIVGHELLSPIVAIDGTVDSIINIVNKRTNNIHKISQKIEDIRLFNKLMEHLVIDVNISGYGEPILCESSLFSLRDLIKNMVYFVSPILRLHRIDVNRITIRYDSDVGERIFTGKLHFIQIFFNLFMNFIKYREDSESFQAGIEVKKKDSSKSKKQVGHDDSRIIIDIWDSGIGIPKGEEERVFEPGYKGSNTLTCPGKGLGLTVVRKILDRYHGTISVANRCKPTMFKIQLPESIFYL